MKYTTNKARDFYESIKDYEERRTLLDEYSIPGVVVTEVGFFHWLRDKT
jgi:hypothetical protein